MRKKIEPVKSENFVEFEKFIKSETSKLLEEGQSLIEISSILPIKKFIPNNSKLNPIEICGVFDMIYRGNSRKSIAQKYSVSPAYVSLIAKLDFFKGLLPDPPFPYRLYTPRSQHENQWQKMCEIFDLLAQGKKQTTIAKKLGIQQSTVSRVSRGEFLIGRR